MKLSIAGFLLVTFAPATLALTDCELAIKSSGIILYNQFKTISATPLLRIAAEARDHEAQYYLAESLRQKIPTLILKLKSGMKWQLTKGIFMQ